MNSRGYRQEEAFCRGVVETRASRLFEELSSLRSRLDEKAIHDTRVASRRMRAALEAFEDLFPARAWRKLIDRMRRITRVLGKQRETEVNLSLLRGMDDGGDMAESLCNEYLRERLRKKLSRQRRALRRKLKSLDPTRLEEQTRLLLDQVRAGKRRRAAPAPALPAAAGARGGQALSAQAKPILRFEVRRDFQKATDNQLHRLRIAAKRLRYAMEIFHPVWPRGLKKEIRMARSLQDAGGEYHDWCVLQDRLHKEIRRMEDQDTVHLKFQVGRLLYRIEQKRAQLKRRIVRPLLRIQEALRPLQSQDLPAGPEPLPSVDRAGGKEAAPR